jgi:hypothetical protein
MAVARAAKDAAAAALLQLLGIKPFFYAFEADGEITFHGKLDVGEIVNALTFIARRS